MKALVLAAGLSTRIAAVAGGGPKVLLRVGGRTLIEWNLVWLAAHGIKHVWVNLYHGGDAIRKALGCGERLGMRIDYLEEEQLLGTAGAWKRLEREWTETSLVVYGDNFMRFDLNGLVAAHVAGASAATVALFDSRIHANTGGAGGRVVLSTGKLITSFVEGAENAGLVNAGVYVLEPTVGDWVGEGHADFGHEVLPRLARAGLAQGHVIEREGFCVGVDTPERFARAKEMMAAGAIAP